MITKKENLLIQNMLHYSEDTLYMTIGFEGRVEQRIIKYWDILTERDTLSEKDFCSLLTHGYIDIHNIEVIIPNQQKKIRKKKVRFLLWKKVKKEYYYPHNPINIKLPDTDNNMAFAGDTKNYFLEEKHNIVNEPNVIYRKIPSEKRPRNIEDETPEIQDKTNDALTPMPYIKTEEKEDFEFGEYRMLANDGAEILKRKFFANPKVSLIYSGKEYYNKHRESLRKKICTSPTITNYCLTGQKDNDIEIVINIISLIGTICTNTLCAFALSILIARGTLRKFCKNYNIK